MDGIAYLEQASRPVSSSHFVGLERQMDAGVYGAPYLLHITWMYLVADTVP